MEVYRTPDEQFVGLPGYDFEPHYVEQDGLRMHYVDEGSGDPVLLLHGEPTWAFLYRKMIPTIAGVARAVAPDYFGFGRSDKPTQDRGLLLRLPLRVDRALRRRARPAGYNRRRPGLGRADRTSARGRAPRPHRAARDPQHRSRGGPGSFRGVAAVPGVRPPGRNRSRPRTAHPHLGGHASLPTMWSRATTRRSRRRSRKPACSRFPSSFRPRPTIRAPRR